MTKPSNSESVLDQLLVEWAQVASLSAGEAAAIANTVLFGPDSNRTDLDCDWWRRLFQAGAVPFRRAMNAGNHVGRIERTSYGAA
jgi:hypothetical protein